MTPKERENRTRLYLARWLRTTSPIFLSHAVTYPKIYDRVPTLAELASSSRLLYRDNKVGWETL